MAAVGWAARGRRLLRARRRSFRAKRAHAWALGRRRPARRSARRADRPRYRALRRAGGRPGRARDLRDPRSGAAGAAHGGGAGGPARAQRGADRGDAAGSRRRADAGSRLAPEHADRRDRAAAAARAAATRAPPRAGAALLRHRQRRGIPHGDGVPLRQGRLPRTGAGHRLDADAPAARGRRAAHAAAARAGGGRLRQRRQRRTRLAALPVRQHRPERAPVPLAGGRVGLPRRPHLPGAAGRGPGGHRALLPARPHRPGGADAIGAPPAEPAASPRPLLVGACQRLALAAMAEVSKAVLITGCSTGIGRATAERLARKGMTVYATARKVESIEGLEAAGCRTLELDVTEEQSMRAAVSAVEEAEGAVGALVNNAGYSQNGAVESLDLDEVRRQFETNVFGLMRMCQLALPGMRRQGQGRIVNVSSMGGKLVFPGGGAYHATKHAVEALSDALRFEVSGFGVQVSIIEPGLIRTEFGSTSVASIGSGTAADTPYADFNTAVGEATTGAYEGRLAKLAGGPGSVARAIDKAITAKRPRSRYRVTLSGRLLLTQRKLVPDRVWDAAVGTSFPKP